MDHIRRKRNALKGKNKDVFSTLRTTPQLVELVYLRELEYDLKSKAGKQAWMRC